MVRIQVEGALTIGQITITALHEDAVGEGFNNMPVRVDSRGPAIHASDGDSLNLVKEVDSIHLLSHDGDYSSYEGDPTDLEIRKLVDQLHDAVVKRHLQSLGAAFQNRMEGAEKAPPAPKVSGKKSLAGDS